MSAWRVERRLFTAANEPQGSPERARLNESALTSQYMTSYPWVAVCTDGRTRPFNSKAAAEAYIQQQTRGSE